MKIWVGDKQNEVEWVIVTVTAMRGAQCTICVNKGICGPPRAPNILWERVSRRDSTKISVGKVRMGTNKTRLRGTAE